jgi:tetratricopeptide (TPR) repeat protein
MDREQMILERVLTLKQWLRDGRGGPVEMHELAVCYYSLENFEKAQEILSELTGEYPDYLEIAKVYSLYILCLVHTKDYDLAEELIKKRMAMNPSDTVLLALLAGIKEKKGKYSDAILHHRRILQLDPDNLTSLNNLGYLLTVHGKERDYPEALDCLKKAVTKKPTYPVYLDSLGVHLGKRGSLDQAKRALEKALRKNPENMEIIGHLKDVQNKMAD